MTTNNAYRGERTVTVSPDQADLIRAARQQVEGLAQNATPSFLPKRIGPYRINRRLGGGGMGVVYEAEQNEPRRRVALKVIRAPSAVDPYHLRLFEREIEVLGRLQHACVARIYDAGHTEDGQPYFAMELIQGRPIVEYCLMHALPLRARLALFAKVCGAVHHAHRRRIIHRDLKPSNILVDEEGVPHVLDFGLARFSEPEMEVTRSLMGGKGPVGTLAYMSPEQTRGDSGDLDTRTDVYSLGVLLYEMLTNRHPYTVTGTVAEVLRNINEADPTRPSTIHKRIDDDLETVVLCALAKDRERRYESVAALEDDVANYLEGRPISAKRDSGLYVLKKLATRHWQATLVAALVLLLLVSSAAISLTFYRWERQARIDNDARAEDLRFTLEAKESLARSAVFAQQETATVARAAQFTAFLFAWHHSNLAEAQDFRDRLPPESREGAGARYLLRDNVDGDVVRVAATRLTEAEPYFRAYIEAERHLMHGERDEARLAYGEALAALQTVNGMQSAQAPEIDRWIGERCAARLATLEADIEREGR